METKLKICKNCGLKKLHRRIDKEYNRINGHALVWSTICEDCLKIPTDPKSLFTQSDIDSGRCPQSMIDDWNAYQKLI